MDHIEKEMNFFRIFPSPSPSSIVSNGTRDGFQVSSFHFKCDGKGPTITLVKSNNGNEFGGYNSQSWNSSTNTYY
ncbi:hypothetical protein DFA_08096 [Cavenderia fasciculata]|uniref:TLDc domain-containing protein n=1 Tax=Cavenderia fasciculata TaxID=261658 RepID=F4Q508_CACFS|nr:uncharacterized protein DFA_08096 [Cavenderia fasciculata]EGG17114.1 hypothetical protein DFA_08096 [Cavenderia fasciculata]|eukprot:XP_004355598.1 hypothetical protein DFA_08096 [Cavenderia fasciculata]